MKRRGGIGTLGRAPVPEWEELARAAWPGRIPAGLAAAAARVYLATLLLGMAALVLAAWARLPWLGLVAWVAVSLVEWLATSADAPAGRLLALVGLGPQARALVRSLPAAGLVFGLGSTHIALAYITVVLVVQLVWFAQPVLATWLSRSAPPLRYLPGAVRQPEPIRAHARAYGPAIGTPGAAVALEFGALAGALAAGSGLVAAAWGTGLAAFVAVLALTALGATVLRAVRLRRAQPGWQTALLAELTASAPSFLVYVSLAAGQSKYIVNQWLPALDALAQNGILLVREASQLSPLAPTRHPVVYGAGPKDVERVTLPSVRAAFYLAYGERNGQLLRDPRLRHVMLLHGDSDKATSANGLARAFDEIWVAGPAAVERYRAAGVDLPASRFVLIGRPQVAGLPVGPSGQRPPILLYAPTFEGYYDQTAHSSLDTMGVDLVEALLADGRVQVWFRPHPASGVSRPSMLAAINQIEALLRADRAGHVVVADLSMPECLGRADLLVSDISSVATDYLFTERPVITCDPSALPRADFVAKYPTQAASYLLHPGLTELPQVLDAALGADPLKNARIAMKHHVLGDPVGGPQAAFAANVTRLASAPSSMTQP